MLAPRQRCRERRGRSPEANHLGSAPSRGPSSSSRRIVGEIPGGGRADTILAELKFKITSAPRIRRRVPNSQSASAAKPWPQQHGRRVCLCVCACNAALIFIICHNFRAAPHCFRASGRPFVSLHHRDASVCVISRVESRESIWPIALEFPPSSEFIRDECADLLMRRPT